MLASPPFVVSLVLLVCLVCLVCLVELDEPGPPDRPDKPDKPDKPEQPRRFREAFSSRNPVRLDRVGLARLRARSTIADQAGADTGSSLEALDWRSRWHGKAPGYSRACCPVPHVVLAEWGPADRRGI